MTDSADIVEQIDRLSGVRCKLALLSDYFALLTEPGMQGVGLVLDDVILEVEEVEKALSEDSESCED